MRKTHHQRKARKVPNSKVCKVHTGQHHLHPAPPYESRVSCKRAMKKRVLPPLLPPLLPQPLPLVLHGPRPLSASIPQTTPPLRMMSAHLGTWNSICTPLILLLPPVTLCCPPHHTPSALPAPCTTSTLIPPTTGLPLITTSLPHL